jgi:ankyrin repeat protein
MGDTALSLAAYHGHLAIINLLLEENGLDVAATDKFGDTRAKCASDVKRAIEAASNCRIALYLEGHLNEEGNFCTCP